MLSLIMNFRNHFVCCTVVLLTACGGNTAIKPTVSAPATQSQNTSSKSETKTGAGGYYLDDGPGENAPADIDSIPSATLKTEQLYARANKPYIALGQPYTPMTTYVPYKKQGIASWYGKRYHGKKTSTGEVYDMYAMSAAHTILPIPSYAKITNPANGRSVIVRINDRGPFKHDRLIDLSYAAAYQLRLIKQGSGLVEVETIDTSAEAMRAMQNNKTATAVVPTESSAPENPPATVQAASTEPAEPIAASKSITSSATTTLPTSTQAAASVPITPAVTQYYVQAGAFKNEVNGNLLQKKIQGLDLAENVALTNVYNNGLYRVKLGPYASKKEADTLAAKIRSQLNIAALVINQ